MTSLMGMAVWMVSDLYQSAQLSTIFQQQLKQNLKTEARQQRQQFLHEIKSYNAAVRLYASSAEIKDYVDQQSWQAGSEMSWQPGESGDNAAVSAEDLLSHKIVLHESVPEWLPGLSMMRNFVLPRYAMLFDADNHLRELYRYRNPIPPAELLSISNYELELSREQTHVTMFGGRPFLLAAGYIEQEGTSLLLVTPIDDVLLRESLSEGSHSIIALLKDGIPEVMVSSDDLRVPQGASLAQLKQQYLITGEDNFATGSSDFMVSFISLLSKREVDEKMNRVLKKDRMTRAINAVLYFFSFVIVMLWITYRIQKLTRKVVAFSSGREILQPELKRGDQLEELDKRFELLAAAIEKETAELEYQANHDILTGMPNRALFNTRLQYELLNGERNNQKFVLMISDLNRFKEINDTLGHHIGDMVIKQTAIRLQEALRKNDTVARLGGDEFAMLLPNTSLDEAGHAIKKIFERFDTPFLVESHRLDVGISIGLVEYPTHGSEIGKLMQHADIAMYYAKNNHTGSAIYQTTEDNYMVARLALMSDLKQALQDNALTLLYQPIIDLKTGRICGAEALLRWSHLTKGDITPDDFIPLAEQTGLIQPLTDWVIENAISQCEAWRDDDFDVSVGINISVSCLQDNRLAEKIREVAKPNDIHGSNCIFEITESVFMKDPVKANKVLTEISKMGIGIAIDDFGTGYSSMSYLKQLPVTELKIDGSFIGNLLVSDNDAVIVRAVIDMAHNLGLKVVAEGVENEETLNILTILGCDKAQGYYFGEPVTSDELGNLLRQNKLYAHALL
ncbi:MAG: bifunctional diguanylate cyclase/phosphodiesterase [Proteobacteria bacterium]|nr:bifunctional diguanylate cyclase/phosphodiesterase [Pseudomonadota bacterium]